MTKHIIATFFISMLPVVELRGGLPYGIALGLDYPTAFTAALVGNMLPVPFLIIYVRRVFAWLRQRSAWLEEKIAFLEERGRRKGTIVKRYELLGLFVLVAIPLPGTGAWTGALVAALLDMRLKRAVPTIFLGVLTAAVIMMAATHGVVQML